MPEPVAATADVIVNYQNDEDREYMEEDYIDDADEPVDKNKVAWVLEGILA